MMIEERDANLEKLQWGIGMTSEKVWWPGWTWFGYYTYKYCDQVQQKPDKNSSPWGGNYQLPVSLQHSNYPEWFHDLPKVNHYVFQMLDAPPVIELAVSTWRTTLLSTHKGMGNDYVPKCSDTLQQGSSGIEKGGGQCRDPGQAACFLKEVNATKIQSSDYLSVIMRSWFSISNETSQLCACLCPAVRGGHDSRCPRAHFSFWHHSRGIK